VSAFLCCLVLTGCGATESRSAGTPIGRSHLPATVPAGSDPVPFLGRFAGYIWSGKVRSLRGAWTVPRVLPGSGKGEAGTWIGAQAPGARENAPFIQAGTNEGRFASPDGRHSSDVYWAFWTDTRHHFLPITLFPVQPGDRIDAALTLRQGQWTISLVDLSSRTSVTFSTSEEARSSFVCGEWQQEDVGSVQRPGPYPLLSPLTFSDLRANGSAPDSAHLASASMNFDRSTLAPSRLADDSFTLRQESPDRPARVT
jgi:Peptidase A4 family